jgi:hypothetical protein
MSDPRSVDEDGRYGQSEGLERSGLEGSGSDVERGDRASRDPDGDEIEEDLEDTPRNPFDNPYFLPVLLLGLSLWFGYDGWFNADEHMQKYRLFNQIGFAVLVLGGIWSLVRARRDTRDTSEREPAD